MDLSIIILNYKQKGLIKQSLKNLNSLNLPFEYEIIVVDNNSGDGLPELIYENFPSIKFIQSKVNKGYGAGNNLGLSVAKGKYLLILNPDVTIEAEAITKLCEFMESHQKAGLAGPKILNPDGSLQYTCSRFPDWRLPFFRRTFLAKTKDGQKWINNYLMKDWNHDSNRQVDWLFGACLMVRQTAYQETGGFDERFFLYMEDLDLARRFWLKNWEVWYVHEAKAIHYHQRMSAESNLFMSLFSKTARIHFASWLKYFLKYKNQKLPRR